MLAVLVALVVAAPAQAATTTVTWPEAREYRPGERIAVTVRGDRKVKVSVLRVAASGKVMRALTRRTLRRGTVTATLDRAGRYAVRVGQRERTLRVVKHAATVPPDCPPAANPALDLTLSADRVQRGQDLPYSIKNTGDTCMTIGVDYQLEHQQADGTWRPVPWPLSFPMIAVMLQPGGEYPGSMRVPADAALGTYRISKTGGLTEPTFEVVA